MLISSKIADRLARFARGAVDVDFISTVAEAIPASWQNDNDEMHSLDSNTLIYERLRRVNEALPPGTDLMAKPWMLCAVLERAAIVEPRLFHLMLLHYVLTLAPIARFGDPERVKSLVTQLETTTAIGCPLITESGRSNSHLHPRTTATYDPPSGGFVLHTPDREAIKCPSITSNPYVGKLATVFAQLVVSNEERGVFVFVVPIRDAAGTVTPGVQVTPLVSSSALVLDYGAVSFNHLHVPFDMWMNDGARITPNGGFEDPIGSTGRLARTMSVGTLSWLAAISLSAAITRAAATVALRYSANHFSAKLLACDQPLIKRRNQCDAIFSAYATAFTLTALANHAKGHRFEDDRDDASKQCASQQWVPWVSVDQELALLKAVASNLAEQTIDRCKKHCGANAAVGTTLFGVYLGIAHSYVTAGGDNELIMLEAGTLTNGTAKPHRPTMAPDSFPTTLQTCRELAQHAEAELHHRVRTTISAVEASSDEQYDALNPHLALMFDASTAKADHIVLNLLEKAIASEPDAQARHVFDKLGTIYALNWVERRASTLFDLGLLKQGTIGSIRTTRAELCDQLLDHIPELVEGFSPPSNFFIDCPPDRL